MVVPPEYHDREQSYLKHRVLQEYLNLWGRKLGSLARRGPLRLWYVDCFAGPWKHRDENLTDTSIDIGLTALEAAGKIWRDNGHDVDLGAVFVEKDANAFKLLREHLHERDGSVETHALEGEFGDKTEEIAGLLGTDPAFVFVDPTGWDGVAMNYIRPLLRPRMREVLVNVMFNHINRFKDDPREFLRQQMREFFGTDSEPLEPGLSEVELLRTYRERLKSKCNLDFAADLAVPHPTQRRTWFRLVIGGKHPDVLDVFRDVESRVVGGEASAVRAGARDRKTERNTGQMPLLGAESATEPDQWYARENLTDKRAGLGALLDRLKGGKRTKFRNVWPGLLEEHHITKSELGKVVIAAQKAGKLRIDPTRRRRTVKDDDLLSLPDDSHRQ